MKYRFYPESDGGPTHNRQHPRTYYVVDSADVDGNRIDCESRAEAGRLARELNAKWTALKTNPPSPENDEAQNAFEDYVTHLMKL